MRFAARASARATHGKCAAAQEGLHIVDEDYHENLHRCARQPRHDQRQHARLNRQPSAAGNHKILSQCSEHPSRTCLYWIDPPVARLYDAQGTTCHEQIEWLPTSNRAQQIRKAGFTFGMEALGDIPEGWCRCACRLRLQTESQLGFGVRKGSVAEQLWL